MGASLLAASWNGRVGFGVCVGVLVELVASRGE